MKDPRIATLAHNLINYSVSLKPGEKILIEDIGNEVPLTRELIREVYKVEGIPFLSIKNNELTRILINDCTIPQMKQTATYDCIRMSDMNAYIGIRLSENVNELGSLSHKKMNIYNEHYLKPVHFNLRVKQTKWCILRYPNHSMAQLAGVSTENFEDFYFDVCNLDYSKMSKAMDNLVAAMNNTDKIHIVGKNTDLTFSIKGLPAIKSDGKLNIPDGEVFSAPVRESINGVITYNTPSVYQGTTYDNISLSFENGKIVKATANNTEGINKIFDTDENSRFVGEFALGLNPYILKPMKDTLFDEKIAGSLHLTPGNCYDECNNGNKSSIHWDLVLIQTSEYGGGEIWFDDKLIRKDGSFVTKELTCLNPENLI